MRRGYELHLELVGCLLPSSIIIGLASLGVNYPPTHTALLLFYEETSESLGPANAADSFFCPFFFRGLYCTAHVGVQSTSIVKPIRAAALSIGESWLPRLSPQSPDLGRRPGGMHVEHQQSI